MIRHTIHRTIVSILLLTLVLVLIVQPSQPAQAAPQDIYTDVLAAGWQNYSWATVDLSASSPVHTGTASIAVTYGAWQGLFLHNPGVATAGFTHVRFFMHGGSAGGQQVQLYAVRASDGQNEHGPEIALPAPAANTWSEVRVALADLGAADTTITGLTWQDRTGGAQPVLYIDDIALVGDESPDAPTLADGSLLPRAAPAGGTADVVVRVRVSDPQGAADVASVTLDARALGRATVTLQDNGQSNDGVASDGIYGTVFTAAAGTPPGEYMLLVSAQDQAGHRANLPLGAFVVLTTPGGATPATLPQPIGWGTNAWSETAGQDWQQNSGVPWNYIYQYITYEWALDGWGGDFVGRFVRQAWSKNYIPVISVYLMLATPPACGESATCYAQKLQNPSAVQAYLTALEEAARQARGTNPVIFQLEPDFYGFMQQLSNTDDRPAGVQPDDPTSYPVALNIAGYPNTLAGFGRRMVDVVHATASNVLVAPHASMWATNRDPNAVTMAEVTSLAQRTAQFMNAMGGAEADLIFIEWSDRDSGSGLRPWWDDTNRTLPRHNRAIQWANSLSAAMGKRLVLWQVPVGNMNLDNTCDRYQDNRVAYSFHHIRDLVDTGIIAVLYGGGASCMTSPATDGGFLASQATIAYAPPAAPQGLTTGSVLSATVPLHWNESTEIDLWGYELQYQQAGSDTWQTRRVGRANATSLLLPGTGTWQVRVAAYDARGQLSTPSAAVTVRSTVAPEQLYLPVMRR